MGLTLWQEYVHFRPFPPFPSLDPRKTDSVTSGSTSRSTTLSGLWCHYRKTESNGPGVTFIGPLSHSSLSSSWRTWPEGGTHSPSGCYFCRWRSASRSTSPTGARLRLSPGLSWLKYRVGCRFYFPQPWLQSYNWAQGSSSTFILRGI